MNLSSIIIILQLAISLLTNPSLAQNSTARQQAIDFSNKAINLAIESLSKINEAQVITAQPAIPAIPIIPNQTIINGDGNIKKEKTENPLYTCTEKNINRIREARGTGENSATLCDILRSYDN